MNKVLIAAIVLMVLGISASFLYWPKSKEPIVLDTSPAVLSSETIKMTGASNVEVVVARSFVEPAQLTVPKGTFLRFSVKSLDGAKVLQVPTKSPVTISETGYVEYFATEDASIQCIDGCDAGVQVIIITT